MAGRRLSIASTGASANSRVTNPNVDTSVNVLGTPRLVFAASSSNAAVASFARAIRSS